MVDCASGPGYYDRAGHAFAARRPPDPPIAAALGDAATIVNVGAGARSYEPPERAVLAVEPSAVMPAQRRSPAPRVRAISDALPPRDGSFDAAQAVLTLHHWTDWRQAGAGHGADPATKRSPDDRAGSPGGGLVARNADRLAVRTGYRSHSHPVHPVHPVQF